MVTPMSPTPNGAEPPIEDPAVTFSRRTAFRFAAGAAGVAAVASAGATPAAAETVSDEIECMADLKEGS